MSLLLQKKPKSQALFGVQRSEPERLPGWLKAFGRPVFALTSFAVAHPSSLQCASVFVKTSPDKSPRHVTQILADYIFL
jgi:hypothetical protein